MNNQNIEKKLFLAKNCFEKLDSRDQKTHSHECFLKYHNYPLVLYYSQKFYNSFDLIFPDSWLTNSPSSCHNKVFFYSPHEFYIDFLWDDLESEQCFYFSEKEYEVVIQRDFVAIHGLKNINETHVICYPEKEKDGVFNFFRYFLPKRFLSYNQLLIHSSAIVINDEAYIFLGHSFSGKTTIASIFKKEGAYVLGDDMNVITKSLQSEVYVEGALIGQTIQDSSFVGKKIKVKQIYLLQKDQINQVTELSLIEKTRALMISLPNLFNTRMSEVELNDIKNLIELIIQNVPISKLKFNLKIKSSDLNSMESIYV